MRRPRPTTISARAGVQLVVRELQSADLQAVHAIERLSYNQGWSLAMFVQELDRPSGLSLGAWDGVADHLVRADSVRTALAFVERGEAPLGIVYATDARDDARVRIVGEFPAGSHAPIVYPVAQLAGAQPGSGVLLAFLEGRTARAAFERHGFAVLATESPQ